MAVAVAGEGGLLCLVSIIKTRQNREHEQGDGRRGRGGKGRQAATWPSALGVIYALLMQIFAEAGEQQKGSGGEGAGSWAFNRSMDGCIDLAMPARAIDQLEKSRSEAIPTEPK